MGGGKTIYDVDFTLLQQSLLDLKEGISRLVLSECDFVTSIPINGSVSSLNASRHRSSFIWLLDRGWIKEDELDRVRKSAEA